MTNVVEESRESRRLETGHDWLDNNGVNLLMAATMSVGGYGYCTVVLGVGCLRVAVDFTDIFADFELLQVSNMLDVVLFYFPGCFRSRL